VSTKKNHVSLSLLYIRSCVIEGKINVRNCLEKACVATMISLRSQVIYGIEHQITASGLFLFPLKNVVVTVYFFSYVASWYNLAMLQKNVFQLFWTR
jgi:hypothetical protein